MNDPISITKFVTLAIFSFSLLFTTSISAEGNKLPSKLENIGFMKNPPKELKEKFPMCDEFLKVKWIDKKKRIGISDYDFYINGHKAGKTTAIIYLGKFNPQFNLEGIYFKSSRNSGSPGIVNKISSVKKSHVFQEPRYIKSFSKKELAQLMDDIKHGVMTKNASFEEVSGIEYKDKLISLLQIGNENKSFADNRENVCIAYPDNQRMWLAEIRTVGKVYSDTEIQDKKSQLEPSNYLANNFYNQLEEYEVLDVNADGRDDFFKNGLLIYSNHKTYQKMKQLWTHDYDTEYGQWTFPPSKKICSINMGSSTVLYLTTDGKNYFFRNECNLNELTAVF